MPLYDIQSLKNNFDDERIRKQSLFDAFLIFRSAFLDLLKQFSDDATEIKLDNFSPLRKKVDSQELIEYTISLNGFDLIIVSTNELYFFDISTNKLASRILIYSSESVDATPFFDIYFREHSEKKYSADMQWFTSVGPKPISGTFPFGADDLATRGEDFAEQFLGQIFRFENFWIEKPTLGSLRLRQTKSRSFGFLKEE